MLDDAEEKLKVAENKLKELANDIKLFDDTWDNSPNKDEEMVEGFTVDFGSLNCETAKSKLNSGNSKQPTDKTDIRGETTSTEKNYSLTASVDMKSVFDEDWRPFDVSPGTFSHAASMSARIFSRCLAAISFHHTLRRYRKTCTETLVGVIKKTTAKSKQISLKKSAKDRVMKLLTCFSLRLLSS